MNFPIVIKKLTLDFHAVIDNELRRNIVKLAVKPHGHT